MTGEVATTPIVRHVSKDDAKKLDSLRKEYEKHTRKAERFEDRGRSRRAERQEKKADKALFEYNQLADKLGLELDCSESLAARTPGNGAPIVPEGVKLTKEQKKEVEKLEKQIKELTKKADKYTDRQKFCAQNKKIDELTELSEEEKTNLVKVCKELQSVKNEYKNLIGEYKIPTKEQIQQRFLRIEDPIKAKEAKEVLIKELKAANMYFGNTKELVKQSLENIINPVEHRNEAQATIAQGYVGIGKRREKLLTDLNSNPADISRWIRETVGPDYNANRHSNEIKRLQNMLNRYHTDEFVKANADKKISEFETITINGKTVNVKDITRITTLTGLYITREDDRFNELKMTEIEKIEVKEDDNDTYQLDFGTMYLEKGDPNFWSEKNTKKLIDEYGFGRDKIDYLKVVEDVAFASLPTLITSALSILKINVDNSFGFHLDLAGDGFITSEAFDDMRKQIEAQLQKMKDENGGKIDINKIGDVIDFDYYKEEFIKKTYVNLAPAVATAVTAALISVITQLNTPEKFLSEDEYNKLLKILTAEESLNSRGGAGHTLNPEEGEMATLEHKKRFTDDVNDVIDDFVNPDEEVKHASIIPLDEAPIIKEAEDCIYYNQAGEFWDGIVRIGYIDQNGKPITNEEDIAEIRRFTKQTLNGFAASSGDMPESDKEKGIGTKIRKVYTCKSGNTYTWNLCDTEPAKRIISTEGDGKFVKSNADYSSTKDQVVQEGRYSWMSLNGFNLLGSGVYTNKADRDSTMTQERMRLEKEKYVIK